METNEVGILGGEGGVGLLYGRSNVLCIILWSS